MADSRSAGVGGLPFAFTAKPSPPPPSPSAPPSASSPPSAAPSAESTLSPTPLRPPPHLGPGGLPIAPQLSPSASLSSPQPRIREWSERLIYETGTSYALGFSFGAIGGTVQGWWRPLPGVQHAGKLRANAVLNAAGKASASYANSFAVFALMYSVSRSVSRWGYRRWVGEVGPARYQERDDAFEGVGVAVAGTLTAFTQMGLGRALACGGALGGMMLYGLQIRRKLEAKGRFNTTHI